MIISAINECALETMEYILNCNLEYLRFACESQLDINRGGGNVLDSYESIYEGFIESVSDFIRKIFKKVRDFFSRIYESFRNIFSKEQENDTDFVETYVSPDIKLTIDVKKNIIDLDKLDKFYPRTSMIMKNLSETTNYEVLLGKINDLIKTNIKNRDLSGNIKNSVENNFLNKACENLDVKASSYEEMYDIFKKSIDIFKNISSDKDIEFDKNDIKRVCLFSRNANVVVNSIPNIINGLKVSESNALKYINFLSKKYKNDANINYGINLSKTSISNYYSNVIKCTSYLLQSYSTAVVSANRIINNAKLQIMKKKGLDKVELD